MNPGDVVLPSLGYKIAGVILECGSGGNLKILWSDSRVSWEWPESLRVISAAS